MDIVKLLMCLRCWHISGAILLIYLVFGCVADTCPLSAYELVEFFRRNPVYHIVPIVWYFVQSDSDVAKSVEENSVLDVFCVFGYEFQTFGEDFVCEFEYDGYGYEIRANIVYSSRQYAFRWNIIIDSEECLRGF